MAADEEKGGKECRRKFFGLGKVLFDVAADTGGSKKEWKKLWRKVFIVKNSCGKFCSECFIKKVLGRGFLKK
jgi:hypothetical protein